MSGKWTLAKLFHGKDGEEQEAQSAPQDAREAQPEERPEERTFYLPEVKGALLRLWELWRPMTPAPLLAVTAGENAPAGEKTLQRLEHERLRLTFQLEQEAKKRLRLIEKGKERESFSLNSSCVICLSRDKMLAWAFFFPPYGPEGQFEAGALGRALQSAGVTTGIDQNAVVSLLQTPPLYTLLPVAAGTDPLEGRDGEVVELFTRELVREVVVDEDGTADYRSLNYVRQIQKDTPICDIIPPVEGTPGVQVDGAAVAPKAAHAARVPRGTNTILSEDGRQLLAARDGHLEFANGAFHVRPLLEIPGDVDYSTGNIEFDGDIHIHGDVREGFVVNATGGVTVDGLVEAATVESGGDMLISRGVVGDRRATLRSKGCIRVKYLENCTVYAGKTVYADCIMTSQINSDEGINVTSGRGSVIGGTLTAAYFIRARMVGAQSGRRTELHLGALPYVQAELETIQTELAAVRLEEESLARDLAYLERDEAAHNDPRVKKMRLRRSMLTLKEKKLETRERGLTPIHPDLSKCRFEADCVYPITLMTIGERTWTTKEIRHRCRLCFDEKNGEIKEIY